MNKKTILILSTLFFQLFIFAQNYGSYKLYASYDFEQDTTDKQGNTTLELKNGATLTNDAVRGNVLSFDRLSKAYAVMQAPIIGDTISLAFWYKRSSNDNSGYWKQIFEFHNPVDDSNIYLMPVYGWDDTKSGLVCDTKSFKKDIWEAMVGNVINADDTWHHIVVIISGTDWYYYLDGELAVTKTIFGSLSVQNPTKLYFGMNPNRGDYPMTCSIDNINIYHYPLSSSQVSQLYKEETVTDPVTEEPITFHFDGNTKEEYERISLTGSGYVLTEDSERKQVIELNNGGQLNFSGNILPENSSTVSFLYKKDSFSDDDNDKYIYQCSNDTSSYGLKLKLTSGVAYLVLETFSSGTKKEAVGKETLEPGKWYAINIFHSISGSNKGTMRIYQNGIQTTAMVQVKTYALNFTNWSLGSTTSTKTAGGTYDELIIENKAYTTTEINSYYLSNLVPISITVDYNDTYQTIRNIGASDAWNTQLIGLYWPENKKEKLAELLFSKDFDANGNPKGIGLSCWRFNIGSGSYEQGDNSYITSDAKRTECFLNSDQTTYNWEKQKGQQWFLQKAAQEYAVEDIIGFMNSPPVYFTKKGYAFNKGGGWNYILDETRYNDYAKFTSDIIQHFDNNGIHFDYISPVNEPQYEWNESSDGYAEQEGSPATDQEIANVVKNMSSEFSSKGLTTQLFVPEAGSITAAVNQVDKFWGDSAPDMKILGLPNVSNIVSSHSYWDDASASDMYSVRNNFKQLLNNTNSGLEYFQTEYSLLGSGYLWGHPNASTGNFKEIECAMSLARMLHVDFCVANATGWQWWTVFEQGNHGGESRFALIEALTKKDLTDGIYNDTKLLYTLGQYSRFVRPGMKRAGITRSDNIDETTALNGQMYSAYLNTETQQVVVIATNTDVVKKAVKISVSNLPIGQDIQFTPYLTDENNDMSVQNKININELFTLPPLSVVTFVSNETILSAVTEAREYSNVQIYPNPVTDHLILTSEENINKISLYDISGRVVSTEVYDNKAHIKLTLSGLAKGVYFIQINTDKGNYTKRIIKK
jgi:O-glycosyl hydrolase